MPPSQDVTTSRATRDLPPYHGPVFSVRVREADQSDVLRVVTMLQEASRWVTALGQPMWNASEISLGPVWQAVDRREVFLVEACHRWRQVVGSLHLSLADPIFWPDVPNTAVYVHRMVVPRLYKGLGVSGLMVRWASDIARACGRSAVRLDCEADRGKLQTLYERLGFRRHSERTVQLPAGLPAVRVVRYELPVK